MSTTTLGMTTQLNDSFNYSVTDPLSDTVDQLVSLQNTFKMLYSQSANTSTATTTVPTKFAILQHTITVASSTFDIDLTAIVDIFGNVLNFTKVNYILVHCNDVAGGSGLLIGGAASNAWTAPFNGSATSKTPCRAGGEWRITDPYTGMTVSAGSKVLRIANDTASPSGSAQFTLIIAGT